MNSRSRAALLRAGAATAMAVGLVAVAGPAYAADGPNVSVNPVSSVIAKGVKKANAKPFQVDLPNIGNADATGVTVKLDLSKLAAGVGFIRPDGCEKTGRAKFTCAVGDIPAGQDVVFGVPLFSTKAMVTDDAGYFSVTAVVPGDSDTEDNSADVYVKVERKTYDLTVWAQDVYAEVVADGDEDGEEKKTPVPPGGTAPLDSAIFNHGSKRVVGLAYSVEVPAGVSFASVPADCYAVEAETPTLSCENDEVVLKPGEVFLPGLTVKVDHGTAAGTHPGGLVYAVALEPGADDAEQPGDEARMATQGQRRVLSDADPTDNWAFFDVFVGTAPTQEPSPSPSEPGNPGNPGGGSGGGDGGLPVTGPQTALIAGVGAAVLAGGIVLLLALRRRRTFSAE
ncbi:cell wall anchor protein [Asanoa iriomotensis]|uniref:LPXTG-motif cell wall-anchored protein n=1 Tax=Asanoa iriomotensis TaxID=234613 RepID=A0ABQ4C523_9ACTN|nr:cell wall anchor protein [Asanoa iriomotensis]GIF57886.1 hypothetical protein Air01nite_39810 [Asanoa iriomotensis]